MNTFYRLAFFGLALLCLAPRAVSAQQLPLNSNKGLVAPDKAAFLMQFSETHRQLWQQSQQAHPAKVKKALRPLRNQKRLSLPGRDVAFMGFDLRGHPIFNATTSNVAAALSLNTQQVNTGGTFAMGLDGQNMVVHEWDGGAVLTTHTEYGGRVTQADGSTSLSNHATHVAGTMVAQGLSANAKGMASMARLSAYDWNNDVSEMAAAAANGALVSNHSYGSVAGWNWDGVWYWMGDASVSATEDYKFGYYDYSSRAWDIIARNAPYYLIVKAAGNNRGETGPGAGGSHYYYNGSTWAQSNATRSNNGSYDCLATFSTAKNILTVGAVEDVTNHNTPSAIVMSGFSSWGPTDDGRIKPDVVANGVSLFSTAHNGGYTTMSGTSMASPSVTGSLLLVQQYHTLLRGRPMRSASLKALAINYAHEAGTTAGPDYRFGWGLMSTSRMCQSLNYQGAGSLLAERRLNNGATFDTLVEVKAGSIPKLTMVWTDVEGTVSSAALNSRTPKLVNDLDVRLISPSGVTYFPWKLDPAQPAAAATRGDNIVDNVEQTEGIVEPGFWRVVVSHKRTLQGGSQEFSLAMSGLGPSSATTAAAIKITNPVPNQNVSQGQNLPITWFNSGTSTNYKVDLYQGGTLVSNLINNYTSVAGNFMWTIPGSVAPGAYELRVSDLTNQASTGTVLPVNVGVAPNPTTPITCASSVNNMAALNFTSNWQSVTVTPGQAALFPFTCTGPGETFSFNTCNTTVEDTKMRLYGPTGTLLGEWDDNGPYCSGTAASADITGLSAGKYFLLLTTFDCNALTSGTTNLAYKSTSSSSGPAPVMCLQNPVTKPSLVFTSTWQTMPLALGSGYAIPFASTSASITYAFSTCGAGIDTKMRLYSDQGVELSFADDNGPHCISTAASANFTGLAPGNYFLLVTEYDCIQLTDNVTLSYRTVAPVIPTCATDPEVAPVLSFTSSWQLLATPTGKALLVPFASQGGSYTYSFSTCGSTTANTKLRLYSSTGTLLQQADDNGPHCTGTASSADFTGLAVGNYYVLLTTSDCGNLTAATTGLNYRSIDGPVTCAPSRERLASINPIQTWQNLVMPSGPAKLVPFTVVAPAQTFSFSTCGSTRNTKFRLYNSSGTQVAEADDFGPYCNTTAASANFSQLNAGEYFLLITEADCAPLSDNVTLQYRLFPTISTCSNVTNTTLPLSLTTSWQTVSTSNATTLLMPFTSQGSRYTYSFSTCNTTLGDTKMSLYNAAGTIIATADNNGPYCTGTTASADFTGLAAGDYFVHVFSGNCGPLNAAAPVSYKYAEPAPVTCQTNEPLVLPAVTPLGLWQHVGLRSGSAYFVPFTATSASQVYAFSTCGASINTRLTLYNSQSQVIARANDNGPHCTGQAASANFTGLTPGYYYVLVTPADTCLPLTDSVTLSYRELVPTITTCSGSAVYADQVNFTPAWQTLPLTAGGPYLIPFVSEGSGVEYSFSTCNTSSEDTRLRVYTTAGVLVSDNDNAISCSDTRRAEGKYTLAAGTYYLLVTANNCQPLTASTTGIRYRENRPGPATCAADRGVTKDIVPTTSWQTMNLEAGTAFLLPFFVGNANEVFSFSTCSTTTDTRLRVYSSTDFMRHENDNNGPYCQGTAASMDFSSPVIGWHYLLVTGSGCSVPAASVTLTYKKALECMAPPVVTADREAVCWGTATLSSSAAPSGYGYLWNTGATTQSINITTGGTYSVRFTSGSCSSRTAPYTIATATPPPAPVINAANTVGICNGDSIVLRASSLGATGFIWNNSMTGDSLVVKTAGTYSVRAIVGACTTFGTQNITVSFSARPSKPTINGGAGALTLCQGGSQTLTATATGATSFRWSNGATGSSITVTSGGTYTVYATSNGTCSSAVSAPIVVTELVAPPTPAISASGPLAICQGNSITLTSSNPTGNVWSNGAITQSITVSGAGTYTVRTYTGGCSSAISAPVVTTVSNTPATPAILATGSLNMCQGSTVTLSTSVIAPNYIWSNGSTTPTIQVTDAGAYTVRAINGACTSAVSAPANVTVKPLPDSNFVAIKDSLLASQVGATYQWYLNSQPLSTARKIKVSQTGTYRLRVVYQGCTISTAGRTIVDAKPVVASRGQWLLYPNPVEKGTLFINGPAVNEKVAIEIVDVLGRTVHSDWLPENSETSSIDVKALPAGQYTVRMRWSDQVINLKAVIR